MRAFFLLVSLFLASACVEQDEENGGLRVEFFPSIIINADRSFVNGDIVETIPGASFAFQFSLANPDPELDAVVLAMQLRVDLIDADGQPQTLEVDVAPPLNRPFLLLVPPNRTRRFGWTYTGIDDNVGTPPNPDTSSIFNDFILVPSLPKRGQNYRVTALIEGVFAPRGNILDTNARNLVVRSSFTVRSNR